MLTAVIFGVNGQDGYYLTKYMEMLKLNVIGISRKSGDIIGDVSDFEFVKKIISHFKPNYIFHFAANSTTVHSEILNNHSTISTGTLNILESARMFVPDSKIFISGSALQFRNNGLPINESTPFEANSAYSLARINSTLTARYYKSEFDMKVYVGYFFNHDSPLRKNNHINQKIASSITDIINGKIDFIEIGNLKTRKEFNFAGDIVKAVWLLVNQDNIFEAVIGSGKHYSILDWVQICFDEFNLNWQQYVKIKNEFKSDYEILVSDPNIIKSLGWKQETNINELARMMIHNISH
jgi:GDPmannose 4,6-dehydratase